MIAKEFKFHSLCYQKFTSGYALNARCSEEKSNTTDESCYSKDKFEEVKHFVNDEIIDLGRAVSMNLIHKIYELGVGDCRYRNRLKLRLQSHFKDSISFKSKSCDIVIPTTFLEASVINHNRIKTVQVAASYIREDI